MREKSNFKKKNFILAYVTPRAGTEGILKYFSQFSSVVCPAIAIRALLYTNIDIKISDKYFFRRSHLLPG